MILLDFIMKLIPTEIAEYVFRNFPHVIIPSADYIPEYTMKEVVNCI